jgi:1-acyl-sn-glycerol-3-phosphate acyltransferase
MTLLIWNLVCRLITLGSRVKVQGTQNIPEGPCIFAINHPTSFDPCYVYRFTKGARILMTKFVFDLPVAGKLMSGLGFIPVPIEGSRVKSNAYLLAMNALLKGESVLIAPEGKMSPDVGNRRSRSGCMRLAVSTRCPVVPIGIRHVGKIYKFKIKDQPTRFMPFGKTYVNIGKPIYLNEVHGDYPQYIMNTIDSLSFN